jgi:hypothetical protein
MTPAEAKLDLERRLMSAGFRFDAPRLDLAWRAFREHLAMPMQGARDYVLAESGVFEFDFQPLRPAFTIDLCRQFGHFDETGEFEGYEQLHLMLYYPADPLGSVTRLSEFWEEGLSQDELFAAVESSRAFQSARHANCVSALLMQWDV